MATPVPFAAEGTPTPTLSPDNIDTPAPQPDCIHSWNWKTCSRVVRLGEFLSPSIACSGPAPRSVLLWIVHMQRIATDRIIFANNPLKNAEQGFVDNQITNTKYTAISFIPKTLAEQFRYALIPSFSRVSGPAEEVVPVRCLPLGASSHLGLS